MRIIHSIIILYIVISGIIAGLAQNAHESQCGKQVDHMEILTASLLWGAAIPYALIVDVEKSGCGCEE